MAAKTYLIVLFLCQCFMAYTFPQAKDGSNLVFAALIGCFFLESNSRRTTGWGGLLTMIVSLPFYFDTSRDWLAMEPLLAIITAGSILCVVSVWSSTSQYKNSFHISSIILSLFPMLFNHHLIPLVPVLVLAFIVFYRHRILKGDSMALGECLFGFILLPIYYVHYAEYIIFPAVISTMFITFFTFSWYFTPTPEKPFQ